MSTNIFYSENNFSNYLTINKAAKYLGVSTSTMRNWEKAGKLIPYRNPMNNYRLYRRIDLDKILGQIQEQRETND
jgi:MerR family transcriptional regulator, copper efflux regulator